MRAAAAAALYPAQAAEAVLRGVLDHLVRVEMPFAAAAARVSWNGVRLDRELCRRVAAEAYLRAGELARRLRGFGVRDPHDDRHLADVFRRLGVLDGGGAAEAVDGDALEALEGRHPCVALVRAARRVAAVQTCRALDPGWVGAGGRVHPAYRVLGTHTGRLTCRAPNVTGLGRVFRPLVVPDPGCGVGEADLAQVEPAVAAGLSGDPALTAAVNTGDVYAAAAKQFLADGLPAGAAALPDAEFRARYPHLRDRAKACVLGLLYGMTAAGLAARLGVAAAEAGRGSGVSASGLRRYRPHPGHPSAWERNWLANFPVQATAATVFKAACVRLDRLYRPLGARLIIPMHDGVVFEAPVGVLGEVAELTARVLADAVREQFPAVRPRVVVNAASPGCWNADGRADSVERWLADAPLAPDAGADRTAAAGCGEHQLEVRP
jgi:DNA polymerase-1